MTTLKRGEPLTYSAVIVAGGSGSRAGVKKQWLNLGGKSVLDWSVEAFREAGAQTIVVVVGEDDEDRARKHFGPDIIITTGSSDRAGSVTNGLKALKPHVADGAQGIVMIHDAARPLLTSALIDALLVSLKTHPAAILALPVTDTLKLGYDGIIESTPPRDNLWRAQTPQAFRLDDIVRAFDTWPEDKVATDEAMVAAHAGIEVALVAGDMRLHKLTYAEDHALLEALILKDKPLKQIRIGQGFDAHRWGDGTSVWLCGVEIVHDKTLIGHSDADAGLHALTDALLGAIGEGDIGDHFPPTDPQWKGVASEVFLKHAVKLIHDRGGNIANVDITIICERPKIKPHRAAMRQRLSEMLGVTLDRVSVKATTTEKMGFTGREEGLAASAVCCVELPN